MIFCLFVAFGMIRAMVADTPLPHSFASELRHRVSYQGVVVSDPDIRDANQRIEVRVQTGEKQQLYSPFVPRTSICFCWRYGCAFPGTLLVPEAFADDGGRVFNYEKYLERDGVRFILDFGSISVLQKAPWYSVGAALAYIKHLFLNGLQATLPEPYASLAGGVVIGGKTGLGNDLQQAFIRSGLVQIVVLSGYNVMIVAEWVMAALALTKLSRRWSASAGALAILLFVGIAGTISDRDACRTYGICRALCPRDR